MLSDASHPVAPSAAMAETPACSTAVGAGMQPLLSNRAGMAAGHVPVGVSPLQAGLNVAVRSFPHTHGLSLSAAPHGVCTITVYHPTAIVDSTAVMLSWSFML